MLPYLSLAIWVPIAAGLAVLTLSGERDVVAARWLALVGAIAGFAVTIPLFANFTLGTSEMQFVEAAEWIPRFNVNYLLGVDGISVLFILLNSFITVLVVWAGWVVIQKKVAQYMAAFLIMSGLINGVFAALDGVLFYVFFEAMLIPMYLIIGIWGGPNRVYAAIKFFLYTFLGSVLMLVALIYLYAISGGSFSILDWYELPLSMRTQIAALRRLLRRLRGEGADVAGAHLAARRAPGGADRRLGGAGGDHAEGRRVRIRALHPARSCPTQATTWPAS